MDMVAVVDEVLHEVVAAVVDRPVQLVVQPLNHFEELVQLLVQDFRQLQVN
jgi:hypothetical protein